MYVTPDIIATFDAADLLGEAYAANPGNGNCGNAKPVGNAHGSCFAVDD